MSAWRYDLERPRLDRAYRAALLRGAALVFGEGGEVSASLVERLRAEATHELFPKRSLHTKAADAIEALAGALRADVQHFEDLSLLAALSDPVKLGEACAKLADKARSALARVGGESNG